MRLWVFIAAINGAIAVAMGAMGAHLLERKIGPEQVEFVSLASNYQLWHALALLGTALLSPYLLGRGRRLLRGAAIAFTVGMILFCGGLYVLALTGPSIVHYLIPLGGTGLIIGWFSLAAAALSLRANHQA